MNVGVLLFFIHNIVATALLGYKFFNLKDTVFRNFGIALLLNSLAFVIWSAAVVLKPNNLGTFVTLGAIPFLASLVFLLYAGTEHVKSNTRMIFLGLGAAIAVLIFILRTFIFPSAPGFSPEGLFFFNLAPLVQMLYIFGLALTAFPAIDAVASKFKKSYGTLIRYGFTIEIMGGIILMTTTDTSVLYIIGWIMGSAYFALWSILLFSKRAWSGVN